VKALLFLAVLAAPAHAGHACAETNEVLGHRHCTPYGAWAALARFPSITFDTEMFREHFATPPLSSTPVAGIFSTTTEAAPDATAWGVRLRIGAPLQFHPLYLAFELDVGGLSSPTTPSYALFSQVVAALGAHAHVTQSIMLSAELAGGGRMYSWMTNAEETVGAGVLEARGRIDWWATPHLTFGAALGTSLITSGDQTFTVGFAGHLRAFDASFY
jgi:hypothetical protein